MAAPVDTEAQEVEAAALVALAGLDPIAFLNETDPLRVRVIEAVARRVLDVRREERAEERAELAILIRNEITEAFG